MGSGVGCWTSGEACFSAADRERCRCARARWRFFDHRRLFEEWHRNVSAWAGAPDDVYLGLGAGNVTFDFGTSVVVNRPGLVDLDVCEVDTDAVEFSLMTIGVSQDGVTFTSIKTSETTLVRTSGDSVHDNSFGRSHNLGAFDWIRYVLIDGLGTGGAGGANARGAACPRSAASVCRGLWRPVKSGQPIALHCWPRKTAADASSLQVEIRRSRIRATD
jgi:hypothetical protein